MSFFNTATTSTVAPTAPADKDIEVADPPADSISSLAFSSAADYLAVGSWDNNVSGRIARGAMVHAPLTDELQVRLYEVGAGGQTQGKAMYGHQGPVLSVCWNKVRSAPSPPPLSLPLHATATRMNRWSRLGRQQGHLRGCGQCCTHV